MLCDHCGREFDQLLTRWLCPHCQVKATSGDDEPTPPRDSATEVPA